MLDSIAVSVASITNSSLSEVVSLAASAAAILTSMASQFVQLPQICTYLL